MASRWGNLASPVVISDDPEAYGDPSLTRLGLFLAAYLFDQAADAVAQAVPSDAPVRTVNTFDPREGNFTKNQLPGLYLFREDQEFEREAEDYLTSKSKLTVFWLQPQSDQVRTSKRSSLSNLIGKVVAKAINVGRTPSYLVAGDTDPIAATLGSLLRTQLDAWTLELKRSGRTKVSIPTGDGKFETYFGTQLAFELVENEVDDLDDRAANAISLTVTQSTRFADVYQNPVIAP